MDPDVSLNDLPRPLLKTGPSQAIFLAILAPVRAWVRVRQPFRTGYARYAYRYQVRVPHRATMYETVNLPIAMGFAVPEQDLSSNLW